MIFINYLYTCIFFFILLFVKEAKSQTVPLPTNFPSYTKNKSIKSDTTKSRWVYGLELGGSVGNNVLIQASPSVGYRVTKSFILGAGLPFMYSHSNTSNVSRYVFGLKSFIRWTAFKGFYLQSEYELLNTKQNNSENRIWTPVFWLGGGYNLKLFGKASTNITFLYNPIHNSQTPYNLPFDIRVGFQLF